MNESKRVLIHKSLKRFIATFIKNRLTRCTEL